MRLFHAPLAPHGRYVRLVLAEKNVAAELIAVDVWRGAAPPADGEDIAEAAASARIAGLSPDGDAPALEAEGRVLRGAAAIAELLEERGGGRKLLADDAANRSETRRLVDWFNHRFYEDVARPMLEEKLVKKLRRGGPPSSDRVRAAAAAAREHLRVVADLCAARPWLAGDALSLADYAAASQISTVDYLGGVFWDELPGAREWYALLKCRPAFRGLLADKAPELPPAAHYTDLDF